MNLLSAGGAVTRHAMVRDIIAHEEYRNKGVKVLLNDIGKFSAAGFRFSRVRYRLAIALGVRKFRIVLPSLLVRYC